MKRILVPCDFSQPSREAFKAAVEIAAKRRGEVTVLHVIMLPNTYDDMFAGGVSYNPQLVTQMQEEAEKAMADMISALPKGSPRIHSRIEFGLILEVITQTIQTDNIDLVVMGRTGVSGLMHFLVGSVTEKVVRFSPVPVLVVEKSDFIKSVKSILLPSTLTLDQTDFIARVKVLQEFFNATLHILHVNTPSHFKRNADGYAAMDEFAKHYRLTNFKTHFVNDYTEEAGIMAFALGQKIDLIAMGTHARKGLSHLFNTSITEDLVDNMHGAIWTCALKTQG